MQEPLCEKGFLQHYTPTPHIIRIRMGGGIFFATGDLLLQLECVNWIRTSSRSGCCRRR